MNIYDFIDNPFLAVSGGYRPSYLTKVSFLLNMIYSFRWFTRSGSKYTSFGLNYTVIDNVRAILWAIVWSFFCNIHASDLLVCGNPPPGWSSGREKITCG